MKLIFVLLLLCSLKSFAQYPFEKYPALKYTKVPFRIIHQKNGNTNVAVATYLGYRFEMLEKSLTDSTNLLVYFKNSLIKKVVSDFTTTLSIAEPLYVGDINGDGLPDFKIVYQNDGSGLAGSLVTKLYLFNTCNNHFKRISFCDFYCKSKNEYDFNGDGNYEILGQNYISYKNHSYWGFDLYNYRAGKFVNVSKKYNYPIMVRFLAAKESFKIANTISRATMKTFSLELPGFYEQDK
jgi:hypothetical protein